MTPLVDVSMQGRVRVLTMNRPAARNALSGELISALYSALIAADADEQVSVIVLTGADPAFCAGVDLKELARDRETYLARFDTEDCIRQVALTSTPVIAPSMGPPSPAGWKWRSAATSSSRPTAPYSPTPTSESVFSPAAGCLRACPDASGPRKRGGCRSPAMSSTPVQRFAWGW